MIDAIIGYASTNKKQISRYIIVGILAVLIYSSSAMLLNKYFKLDLTSSSFIAISLSTIFSYFSHHVFTYKLHSNHSLYFPRYIFIVIMNYICSTSLIYFSSNVFLLTNTKAVIITAVFMAPISYAANTFWTFTRKVIAAIDD